jgi:hypothetical protein
MMLQVVTSATGMFFKAIGYQTQKNIFPSSIVSCEGMMRFQVSHRPLRETMLDNQEHLKHEKNIYIFDP